MNQSEEDLAELASDLAIENEQLKQENTELKEELDRISDLLEKANDIIAKQKMRLDDICSISYNTFKDLEQIKNSVEYMHSLSNT